MLDKLEQVEARFVKVNDLLCLPETVSDQSKYAELMRELKNLTPIVETFREYKNTVENGEAAKEMLSEHPDKELQEMLELEIEESKEKAQELTEKLKVLLLPKDPNDDKNVIIEIRAGAGGEEAALFANSLFRMYSMYSEGRGWHPDVLSVNETGLGGIKEISFMIEGEGAYSRFKFESGVHRVQRVPETESGGRIHTSTVTVAVLPEAQEVDIDIDPTDLQIDTYRSSGAGGQHVNKTDSAIRITHIPTGIVVSCQTQRSQHQNREYAMRMLKSKLAEIAEQQQKEKIEDIKGVQKEIAWGSQIRSYVFHPYNLVKDHRTGFEMGNIGAVMDGDLNGFINAYLQASSLGKL